MRTHSIIFGLFRECKLCKTIDETSTTIVKELTFDDNTYILVETKIDNEYVWRIYNSKKELSVFEIVDLYAYHNLRRHLIT